MSAPKTGPLTTAELQSVWESAVDPSFSGPLKAAGEGNGFEAYTQAFAQHARVSAAIDATTQSMFILPWSGQSAPPAGGPARATVSLSITRANFLSSPLVVGAGTLVGEQIVDWAVGGGVAVLTGRRYALLEDAVFAPGETGPVVVDAQAERPGAGYNNPAPGTITAIAQPGTRFTNGGATVRGVNYPAGVYPEGSRVFLDAINEADAFVPDHVGQYVSFTAGANAGKMARVVGWLPPNLSSSPPTGGTVELARDGAIVSYAGTFTSPFVLGEPLGFVDTSPATVGAGTLLEIAENVAGDLTLVFRITSGILAATVLGLASLVEAVVGAVLYDGEFALEAGTASWVVLDWVTDWGVAVTNPASPAGGRAGMLDALGRERDINRSPNETDERYRVRVASLADVVAPNAIRRALNRAIPGIPWCFREVGSASYPGFFFDRDAYDYDAVTFTYGGSAPPFLDCERVSQVQASGVIATGRARYSSADSTPTSVFWGVTGVSPGTPFVAGAPVVGEISGASLTPDAVVGGLRAGDRFKVWLDYETFRGWFFVGLPPLGLGDPGFAYDTHPRGAYDTVAPFEVCYDGRPYGDSIVYRQVPQAIDAAHAGGVGWTFFLDPGPCP